MRHEIKGRSVGRRIFSGWLASGLLILSIFAAPAFAQSDENVIEYPARVEGETLVREDVLVRDEDAQDRGVLTEADDSVRPGVALALTGGSVAGLAGGGAVLLGLGGALLWRRQTRSA
jgi:hypothetical protein